MKLKKFLIDNKIYFETVAATALTIMAIAVSIFQMGSTDRQNELIEKQNEISELQTKLLEIELASTIKIDSLNNITDSIQLSILTDEYLINSRNLEILMMQQKLKKLTAKNRLKNALWEIFELLRFHYREVAGEIFLGTRKNYIKDIAKVRKILESQIPNIAALNDKKVTAIWEKIIDDIKYSEIYKDMNLHEDEISKELLKRSKFIQSSLDSIYFLISGEKFWVTY